LSLARWKPEQPVDKHIAHCRKVAAASCCDAGIELEGVVTLSKFKTSETLAFGSEKCALRKLLLRLQGVSSRKSAQEFSFDDEKQTPLLSGN
jgi:hypothetical protein